MSSYGMIERCMAMQWKGLPSKYQVSLENSWFVAELLRDEIVGPTMETHLWWLEGAPPKLGNQAILMKVCFE